jgi:hypothetical protein
MSPKYRPGWCSGNALSLIRECLVRILIALPVILIDVYWFSLVSPGKHQGSTLKYSMIASRLFPICYS